MYPSRRVQPYLPLSLIMSFLLPLILAAISAIPIVMSMSLHRNGKSVYEGTWHDDYSQLHSEALNEAHPLQFDFWPPEGYLQDDPFDAMNLSDSVYDFDPTMNQRDESLNEMTLPQEGSDGGAAPLETSPYDPHDTSIMAMLHRAEQTPEVREAIEVRRKKQIESEARNTFMDCAANLGYDLGDRASQKRFFQYARGNVIETLRSGNEKKIARATKFLLTRRRKGYTTEEAATQEDMEFISDEEDADVRLTKSLDALPRVLKLAEVDPGDEKAIDFWKKSLEHEDADRIIGDIYSGTKRKRDRAIFILSGLLYSHPRASR